MAKINPAKMWAGVSDGEIQFVARTRSDAREQRDFYLECGTPHSVVPVIVTPLASHRRPIWLKRIGDHVIVEVERDGKWVEVIREQVDGAFSHIWEDRGEGTTTVSGAPPDPVVAVPVIKE